jgi:hypothetical protein
MYEGNGRGSIPLFGASEENGATDFGGQREIKLEMEKECLCSGLRRFSLQAVEKDGIW